MEKRFFNKIENALIAAKTYVHGKVSEKHRENNETGLMKHKEPTGKTRPDREYKRTIMNVNEKHLGERRGQGQSKTDRKTETLDRNKVQKAKQTQNPT